MPTTNFDFPLTVLRGSDSRLEFYSTPNTSSGSPFSLFFPDQLSRASLPTGALASPRTSSGELVLTDFTGDGKYPTAVLLVLRLGRVLILAVGRLAGFQTSLTPASGYFPESAQAGVTRTKACQPKPSTCPQESFDTIQERSASPSMSGYVP